MGEGPAETAAPAAPAIPLVSPAPNAGDEHMTVKEMREKRASLIAEARKIAEKAKAENRAAMSAEEQQSVDRLFGEDRELAGKIEAEERAEQRNSWLANGEKELREPAGRIVPPGEVRGREAEREDRSKTPVEFELRGYKFRYEPGTAEHRRSGGDYLAEYRRYLATGERRDLQMDLDVAGGYTVAPEQTHSEVLRNVDNATPFRAAIRKIPVTGAASLGVAAITDRISSRTRGSELGAPTPDTNLKFGKRSLTPSPTVGLIKVSKDLLRVSTLNPEAIVSQEIAYEEAIGLEQEYMTGGGGNAPLGIFVASDNGIPTTRDISTGNTSTAITFDGLTRARMALKVQYRNRASWLFHRDAITQIMLIKDGNGNYIWQPSKLAGEPDRLLGNPVLESEYAPSTFTASQYVGAILDPDWYWHVDQIGLEIQRLVELYAATNQVGFMYRAKNDAAPMKAEAFVRVKLSA
jgi:HK97 family phage major capsid protein